MRRFYEFFADRRAATSIEYAVIATLVSIAIIGGVSAIGTRIQSQWYNKLGGNLS